MRYRRGAVTGMRVWLAEEGSGTKLAAQNHSCLDRFAVEPSLPYITPPPGRNSGSERGLSVSPLLRVSQGGGIPPTHQERCHWQEAGLLPPLVKSQNCALSSPSNLVVGPVFWTGIIDKETWLGQHLVLWLISGAGCFAFLPKEVY